MKDETDPKDTVALIMDISDAMVKHGKANGGVSVVSAATAFGYILGRMLSERYKVRSSIGFDYALKIGVDHLMSVIRTVIISSAKQHGG